MLGNRDVRHDHRPEWTTKPPPRRSGPRRCLDRLLDLMETGDVLDMALVVVAITAALLATMFWGAHLLHTLSQPSVSSVLQNPVTVVETYQEDGE